jgi:hypothetical protein
LYKLFHGGTEFTEVWSEDFRQFFIHISLSLSAARFISAPAASGATPIPSKGMGVARWLLGFRGGFDFHSDPGGIVLGNLVTDSHDQFFANSVGTGFFDGHSANAEMVFKKDFDAVYRVGSEPQGMLKDDFAKRLAVKRVVELFLKRRRLVEGLHQPELKDNATVAVLAFLGHFGLVDHYGKVLTGRKWLQRLDIVELHAEDFGKIRIHFRSLLFDQVSVFAMIFDACGAGGS